MSGQTERRLRDVLDACVAIESIVADLELLEYEHTLVVRLATERLISIIGEALNQARHYEPSIQYRISDFNLIIGMRNQLVHGYADVDDEIVWTTARESAPVLAREIAMLLSESIENNDRR
ncbi:MAG: DUF86 domain-containing protein [Thermomicrobiales bacterium]|nr:DUF86 domain-containing protein [Thermomicrobiales bacterium]